MRRVNLFPLRTQATTEVEPLRVVRSAHGRGGGVYRRAAAFVVTADGARLVAGTRAHARGDSWQGRRAA